MYKVLLLFTILIRLFYEVYSAEHLVRYISIERPRQEFNPRYISYGNITSRRFRRQNPMYYVDMHVETLVYLGNNISFHFTFYKELPNGHRHLMLEMTQRLCDMLEKDRFFGAPMRQGKLLGTCPYKPPAYSLSLTAMVYKVSDSNFNIPCGLYLPHLFIGHGKTAMNIEDDYHLYNMTIPFDAIPPNFPYFKGTIEVNITRVGTNEYVGWGEVAMEVKTMKIKGPRK